MISCIPEKLLTGGASYLPTAANFPMLKHYWPCNYSAADLADGLLTDVIGGVIYQSDVPPTIHATYSQCLDLSGSSTVPHLSGTLASPGTKSIVSIVVGVPNSTSNNFTMGVTTAANNQGLKVACATGSRCSAAINAASTAVGTDGPTGNSAPRVVAAQIAIVPSSTSTLHFCGYDGTTFSNYTDKTMATTPAGGMTAMEQAGSMGVGLSPAAILVLHPTTSFSNAELQSISAWAYWAVFTANDKNKILAPWLRNKV